MPRNCDFGAQNIEHPSEFMQAYRELFHTYESEQVDLPWYLEPLTEWRRRRLSKRIRSKLNVAVREAFDNRKQQEENLKSRSILSLAFQDMNVLTEQGIDEACDQLSTFLFAGHDTTSTLLSWLFYELSRSPGVVRKLHDELNQLFGSGELYL